MSYTYPPTAGSNTLMATVLMRGSRACRLLAGSMRFSPRRSARRLASAMIVSAGLAEPCGGHDTAVADEQVGDAPDAVVGVDHARLGCAGHGAAADEMGVAVDREDVLRFGGMQDFVELVLGVGDVRPVVVALGVVQARDGHPVTVGLIGERDAVLCSGQEL